MNNTIAGVGLEKSDPVTIVFEVCGPDRSISDPVMREIGDADKSLS